MWDYSKFKQSSKVCMHLFDTICNESIYLAVKCVFQLANLIGQFLLIVQMVGRLGNNFKFLSFNTHNNYDFP